MNISFRTPLVYTITLLIFGFFVSCSADGVTKTLEAKAVAFGKVNRINIICDQEIWDGPIGDSIRYYYGAAYQILPQPEPIFDLRHHTMEDIRKQPIRKQLRTFVIVADLADEYSETTALVRKDIGKEKANKAKEGVGYATSVAKNKWATGQTLVYIYGSSINRLKENIIASYSAVEKKINDFNKKMIDATAYFNGANQKLGEEVFAKMKVKMRIPTDFYAAVNDENVMWLRRETSEISTNILLHKTSYTSQSQLSREGIKSIRDSIGRQYISSSEPNSYMRINDVDLPLIVKTTTLNGDYAIEAKGIWDIVNDFMGGAFVSYLVYDPGKEDLLFMDAFVHAPGKNKRDIMQELEYILNTAQY